MPSKSGINPSGTAHQDADNKQPQTLSHEFELTPLRTHFIKSPNLPGANALIDLPPTDYLPTEEEFNVVAAALWTLCVEYDQNEEEKRPKHRDALRSVSLSQLLTTYGSECELMVW